MFMQADEETEDKSIGAHQFLDYVVLFKYFLFLL
jgi:hypothetical protein